MGPVWFGTVVWVEVYVHHRVLGVVIFYSGWDQRAWASFCPDGRLFLPRHMIVEIC